jgi:hypothetical protein
LILAALLGVACAALLAPPADANDTRPVPFWGAKAPVPFTTPPQALKRGEFTWAPKVAPAGPILVVVSLEEQRAYAYRNNVLIGAAMVSTGKKGHETPTGVFTTILKDKDHRSSKYNNAPMPYTQKITTDGVALHAGGIPGYPESHGCVHLPSEFARLLFEAAPKGMTVVISSGQTKAEDIRHPGFLAPVDPDGKASDLSRLQDGQAFRWQPEKSPTGPVSVLVSRHDARILLMRNGIEIGRARIEVSDPARPLGNHVFVAQEGYLDKTHVGARDLRLHRWAAMPLEGSEAGGAPTAYADVIRRVRIPTPFLREAYALFAPGTTMVVTDAPVLASTNNVPMTVFSTREPER